MHVNLLTKMWDKIKVAGTCTLDQTGVHMFLPSYAKGVADNRGGVDMFTHTKEGTPSGQGVEPDWGPETCIQSHIGMHIFHKTMQSDGTDLGSEIRHAYVYLCMYTFWPRCWTRWGWLGHAHAATKDAHIFTQLCEGWGILWDSGEKHTCTNACTPLWLRCGTILGVAGIHGYTHMHASMWMGRQSWGWDGHVYMSWCMLSFYLRCGKRGEVADMQTLPHRLHTFVCNYAKCWGRV